MAVSLEGRFDFMLEERFVFSVSKREMNKVVEVAVLGGQPCRRISQIGVKEKTVVFLGNGRIRKL